MDATPIPMSKDGWLAHRKTGIGASEVATIVGENPFQSPLELWGQKTGRLPSVDTTIPMRAGHALEGLCAELYEEETGRRTQDWGDYTIFQSPDLPYLFVTPDRTTIPQSTAEPERAVELKTTQHDGDPPHRDFIQLHTQMGAMGLKHGSLARLIQTREFFWVDMDFDPELDEMYLKCIDIFWGYVKRNEEPPVDFSERPELKALKLLHPQDNGAVIELDPAAHLAWSARLRLKESINDLEEQLAREESVVVQALGDSTFGTIGEMHFISYKTQTRKGVLKVDPSCALWLDEHDIPYFETPESAHRVLRKTTAKTIDKEAR